MKKKGREKGKTNINSLPTFLLVNLLRPHDSRVIPPVTQILLFDLLPWYGLAARFDGAE
jgi:hypothetical protein